MIILENAKLDLYQLTPSELADYVDGVSPFDFRPLPAWCPSYSDRWTQARFALESVHGYNRACSLLSSALTSRRAQSAKQMSFYFA